MQKKKESVSESCLNYLNEFSENHSILRNKRESILRNKIKKNKK